ncbi:MAG TPA: hypothetical protein PLC40_03550, partial [Candidatus Hydrogenedentes bacterium]|nr:hypothetical protein [Candidatus Hydrogenedentota bacterium]
MSFTKIRIAAFVFTVALSAASSAQSASDRPPRIAFLAVEGSLESMGPHNRAAWEAAGTLADASLLFYDGAGGFKDNTGALCALSSFDAVWHHQGDDIARTPLHGGPGLQAIWAFAAEGGGVLLSGGAVGMMDYCGLEPHVRTQRHQLEHYRDPAFMVPEVPSHPVFAGLAETNGIIGLSHGGCPAVADFYWGGPAEGMVLGNTPAGVERPLVEYTVGSGRMIFFGWRWPDYADLENPYRENLLRLTGNLLAYLADPQQWHPIVFPTIYPPEAHPEEPGIVASRWQALRSAIEDLSQTFPDTYTKGEAWLAQLDALQAEQDRLPKEAGKDAFASVVARF